jgi:hypothetical protein
MPDDAIGSRVGFPQQNAEYTWIENKNRENQKVQSNENGLLSAERGEMLGQ